MGLRMWSVYIKSEVWSVLPPPLLTEKRRKQIGHLLHFWLNGRSTSNASITINTSNESVGINELLVQFLTGGSTLTICTVSVKIFTSQFLGIRGKEESKGGVRQVCLAESREPFLRRKTSRIHHIRPSSCATLHQ